MFWGPYLPLRTACFKFGYEKGRYIWVNNLMNTVNIEVLSLNFFSKTLNGGTLSAEAALSSGTAFKQKVFVLPSLDQSLI